MKFYFSVLLCFTLTSYFHLGMTLRCQTLNYQTTDRFDKVLKTCTRRYIERNNYDSDSFSNESNTPQDSSDSNEGSFDNKFLMKNNSKYYTNEFLNEKNNRNNKADQSTKNDYSRSFDFNSANEKLLTNSDDNYTINYWRTANSSRGNMRNSGNNRNYQESHSQRQDDSCIIQCIFNELNAVDQRGYPMQDSVIQVMTEEIRDPELRDFIEESIRKCFHFLNSGTRNEKCEFSQNLVSCLAEKGKEQCEDWNK